MRTLLIFCIISCFCICFIGCTSAIMQIQDIHNPICLSTRTGLNAEAIIDSVDYFIGEHWYKHEFSSNYESWEESSNFENKAAKVCRSDPNRAIISLKIKSSGTCGSILGAFRYQKIIAEGKVVNIKTTKSEWKNENIINFSHYFHFSDIY